MANLIDALRQKLRIWLSLPETKNTFYVGITSLAADRDRLAYSRWVGRGQSSLIAPEIYALEYTLETGIPLGMSYFHCITVKIDCNKNSEIFSHTEALPTRNSPCEKTQIPVSPLGYMYRETSNPGN